MWDGVYTQAQATRGEKVYVQECGRCHGANLRGGEQGPALTGGDFRTNWAGRTMAELFAHARTMPPDGPGRLSQAQYTDVAAFVLERNAFPARTKWARRAETS